MPADPPFTVRAARSAFFERYGFAEDAYDEAFNDAEIGGLPYRVPNSAARAATLKLHDLHHLATGYGTDWVGEASISAWELGAGGGRRPYDFVLMLWGLFSGLLVAPSAMARAFWRGRGARNLYVSDRDAEAWLDRPLPQLRRALARRRRPSAGLAAVAFVAWAAVATGYGLLAAPVAAALVAFAASRRFARELHALATCPCSLQGAR